MNFLSILCFTLAVWHRCAYSKQQHPETRDITSRQRVGGNLLTVNYFRIRSVSQTGCEMKEWASDHDIDDHTLSVLDKEGFVSLKLLRHLSSKSVTESFQKTGMLSVAQCMVLKKVLQQLCDKGGFDDVELGEMIAAEAHPHSTTENADYRFLLLGKTGSGKSTTGNKILGAEVFSVGNAFGSVTDTCQLKGRNYLGKSIQVMDSPGLFDTERTHEQISIDIVRAVAGMHPGPHAILYVIPIGRYTEEEYKVYTRLKALFDEQLNRYLIVLFTRGDTLEPGETMEDKLKEVPEGLKKVMEECRHRYVLFNNMAADTTPYVKELLRMVDRMTKDNGGQPYSCPKYELVGQRLEEEVQRRLAEVEKREVETAKYVKQLQQETEEVQQAVQQEREIFQEREKEHKQEMQRAQERTDKEKRDLQEKMKQDKIRLEKERDAERKLREKLEEEKKEQIKAMQELEKEREQKEREQIQREEERRLQQETKEREMRALKEQLKQEFLRDEERTHRQRLLEERKEHREHTITAQRQREKPHNGGRKWKQM